MKAIPIVTIAIIAMPTVALAQQTLAPQWDAKPSHYLSPHEIAIAKCFHSKPWVDRDSAWLNQCLARADAKATMTQPK